MIVLNGKDFMEVKLASLIADYDRETLANLYQPIIGFTGFAVYLSLLTEAKNQKVLAPISHSQFFDRMKINPHQFVDARKLLEGIGLIRSYLRESNGVKFYTYKVFAPKTPSEFFDNTLFYGMFINAIGEEEAKKIKNLYCLETSKEDGKEISSSIVDAYKIDYDDPAFSNAFDNKNDTLGRSGAKIVSEFSFEKFFDCLQSVSQISSKSFTKKDMKEIERLATLYGVNEESAANCVASIYNPSASKENRIDYKALADSFTNETTYRRLSKNRSKREKILSSESALAKKINLMEVTSPAKFLSVLQNGTKPAMSDLRLINDISSNFNLPNGVINALVDYALTTNNNVLSKYYVEKVAGSLAREGVTNALDAMNFLNKVKNGTKKKVAAKESKISQEIVEEIEDTKPVVEEESSLDWNSLIDQIDEGGSDGKA